MKTTHFYPNKWQMIPMAFQIASSYDSCHIQTRDLILKNDSVLEREISEMNLNLTKFSAIDIHGQEFVIKDFEQPTPLNIKGMHTGAYLKTKRTVDLPAGTYNSFRFYVNSSGNEMIFSDRSSQQIYSFHFLDFYIENDFRIEKDEPVEVMLSFDLMPFTMASYFNSIRDRFKRSSQMVYRLAHSFMA